MCRVLGFLWILTQCSFILCDFEFPNITFEAFDPEGFRVTFSEMDDVNLIAFHANKNKKINEIAPGEISVDLLKPADRGWSFFNPNLKLQVGDKIYYWVHVQYKQFGYKQPGQVWLVNELLPLKDINATNCRRSISEVLRPSIICEKQLIFDSLFTENKIDEKHWKVAHYIPSFPDYEFCSYQKNEKNIFVKDQLLVINPIAATKNEEVNGELDLRVGCTSHSQSDCMVYSDSGFILPPATSAKMKTTENFKYGTIEIKAKLPAGDWLYPQIYLESSVNRSKRIWIAYARGNHHLNGNGGEDLGGTLLFAGPTVSTNEPGRSIHLSSSKSNNPFSDKFHTYSIVWKPDIITASVNGILFGENRVMAPFFNDTMHVVLGVGVGGLTDFPDYYVSSNNKRKPWKDADRLTYKNFFRHRDDWLPTWTTEGKCLKVEYVKIWAL